MRARAGGARHSRHAWDDLPCRSRAGDGRASFIPLPSRRPGSAARLDDRLGLTQQLHALLLVAARFGKARPLQRVLQALALRLAQSMPRRESADCAMRSARRTLPARSRFLPRVGPFGRRRRKAARERARLAQRRRKIVLDDHAVDGGEALRRCGEGRPADQQGCRNGGKAEPPHHAHAARATKRDRSAPQRGQPEIRILARGSRP